MLVERVRANCVDKVLNGLLDLVVLALELLRFSVDPLGLHLNEGVQSVSLRLSWQVNEDGLGERFEVVLDTVLHDVVDVDNELLELGKTLVHVLKVAIDVHRCPGQDVHAWAKLVLEVLKMRHEQRLGVRADPADDTLIFSKHEGKLVVVHLKLLFLEQDNLGALGDLDADTAKAFGLADKSHDIGIKVHAESVVVRVTDDESGEKTCLGLVDLIDPSLPPFVLEVEEVVSDVVVALYLFHCLFGIAVAQKLLRELLHRCGCAVEEVARPCDGARNLGQVADNRGISELLLELVFDFRDKDGVSLEQKIVFGFEASLQVVTVKNAAELAEQAKRILNVHGGWE